MTFSRPTLDRGGARSSYKGVGFAGVSHGDLATASHDKGGEKWSWGHTGGGTKGRAKLLYIGQGEWVVATAPEMRAGINQGGATRAKKGGKTPDTSSPPGIVTRRERYAPAEVDEGPQMTAARGCINHGRVFLGR